MLYKPFIFGAIVAQLVDSLVIISYPMFLIAVLLTMSSLIDYAYFIFKQTRKNTSSLAV